MVDLFALRRKGKEIGKESRETRLKENRSDFSTKEQAAKGKRVAALCSVRRSMSRSRRFGVVSFPETVPLQIGFRPICSPFATQSSEQPRNCKTKWEIEGRDKFQTVPWDPVQCCVVPLVR